MNELNCEGEESHLLLVFTGIPSDEPDQKNRQKYGKSAYRQREEMNEAVIGGYPKL